MKPWIGVDLDGTLAEYDHWRGADHIGAPIQPMVEKVKEFIEKGWTVKIFTARMCDANDARVVRAAVEAWCLTHIGRVLEVTNIKDYGMVELWDDRAVAVLRNQGIPFLNKGSY